MARADSERQRTLSTLNSLSTRLEEMIYESGIAFCCETVQERANLPRQLRRLESSLEYIQEVNPMNWFFLFIRVESILVKRTNQSFKSKSN